MTVAPGLHNLPLMGGGDWNYGMNRVGHESRGESVWLAFFLYDVLKQFGALARSRGDVPFVLAIRQVQADTGLAGHLLATVGSARDAAVLRALADSPVPVPRLIGYDESRAAILLDAEL